MEPRWLPCLHKIIMEKEKVKKVKFWMGIFFYGEEQCINSNKAKLDAQAKGCEIRMSRPKSDRFLDKCGESLDFHYLDLLQLEHTFLSSYYLPGPEAWPIRVLVPRSDLQLLFLHDLIRSTVCSLELFL